MQVTDADTEFDKFQSEMLQIQKPGYDEDYKDEVIYDSRTSPEVKINLPPSKIKRKKKYNKTNFRFIHEVEMISCKNYFYVTNITFL